MIRIRTSTGGAIAFIATTGVIALIAYLSRSTDVGCDNGWVSLEACAQSPTGSCSHEFCLRIIVCILRISRKGQ